MALMPATSPEAADLPNRYWTPCCKLEYYSMMLQRRN